MKEHVIYYSLASNEITSVLRSGKTKVEIEV